MLCRLLLGLAGLQGTGRGLRFGTKGLPVATAVLSDRMSEDKAGYSPRDPLWREPGLRCDWERKRSSRWRWADPPVLPQAAEVPRTSVSPALPLRAFARPPAAPAQLAAHPVSELHPAATRAVSVLSHFRNPNYLRRAGHALPGAGSRPESREATPLLASSRHYAGAAGLTETSRTLQS